MFMLGGICCGIGCCRFGGILYIGRMNGGTEPGRTGAIICCGGCIAEFIGMSPPKGPGPTLLKGFINGTTSGLLTPIEVATI